jgi:curved DNA-binding protein CbpA
MDLYVRLETANYYELLAVEPNADPLAIKMAYHALMKKFHADKLATQLPASMQEQATRVVQALTQAYEVLSSLKQRGEYDRRLTGEGAEIKERRITTILAAERAFNQGTLALRRQQYDQAATHFAEACELFPEEAEYHAYLGWAQFNHKAVPAAERAASAKESIERSLKINPKGDKAYFFLGRILATLGNKDKARHMFALALRYNKANDEAKTELRRLQAERERERAEVESQAETESLLRKDLDFSGVKKAIKKLFR